MKPGLLISLVAHALVGLLVVLLVLPRQIEVPPEVEVELATGAASPPPVPDAPKPAPEPQPPSRPSPPAPEAPKPQTQSPPTPPPAPVAEPTPSVPVEPEGEVIAPPPSPNSPPPQPPQPPPPPPAQPPTPKQPAAPPSAPPAVRLADGITSTNVEDNPYNAEQGCKNLNNLGPDYPDAARRRGEAGDPKLRVHLDSNGQAFLVEVLESSGHRALDEAARTRLLTWRCLPSTLDGKRVPDMFDIRIHFALE